MKARLLEFIDQLRAAGVRASVAESLDAMAAASTAGIEREALRAGLAATLVKDETDRPTFDALFDRFFVTPGHRRGKGERPQPVGEGIGRGHGAPVANGRQAEEPQAHGRGDRETKPEKQEKRSTQPVAAQRLAHCRELLVTPFEAMEQRTVEEAEQLVADLARRLRAHWRRRLQRAARGRVDFRRTIRASLSTGGVPVAPAFRTRAPGKVDLVALCDLSHSTATAADFFLALLTPAEHFFRRVRLFGYVDCPVEISFEGGQVIPHQALDLAAGSDFGSVLVQLWECWEASFTRNTLVLILGDARNNRRPPRADVLARMRARVRRLVWLNPEQPTRWNTGDSVLATYARQCDLVLGASNLRELVTAIKSAALG
ncbi:MAG: VWA domain-containing protein [Deltaproteobacteria bacterium]|nr:VWA domain-containing protein [Deltaproteobacteria bacterium]